MDSSITVNDLASNFVGSDETISSQVQTLVSENCTSPFYLSGINEDGSVICSRLPLGFDYVLDSIGTVGLYTSIAIVADGLSIISYYDQTNFDVFDLKVYSCGDVACKR